ncbi:acyl-coenzyme A thioesterase PaaI-like protein [Mycolicibacterium sp. BK556]|uniref:PaaI family thioesterase n=1 Tax=Mycobacteriaceae TaxID=1762 RepID=UPI0010D77C3B|nr:PaaI family thioesterase [Mycobacterium sp. BK086]MBB3603989.1 acyl-coenzyme A thioesterase PaaI-like protein [Mycolicibacterium sp. BK556]MBB3634185.1 acyl-coenzyme A thioesterase PaaI-like protein [Mycolicibacterium sp. BK607]MBB3751765.1 acyl-coenzyme A thioesterase PaaI-like protein [Mycolicibacterium sp. BK634]TDO12282.1 acyl-coenzyme A thioesterase PaaI-like protein [Mycobacterium sp. BK086]
MLEFTVEDISAEDIDRLQAIYEPLAISVRELIDATIRTRVDAETVASVKADIDAVTARLRSDQIDGAFGVRRAPSGRSISWGNAVIGLRNPSAPPLVIHRDDDGRFWTDFHLGASYEGPPGHVHGGVSALILDHVLGEAASPDGKPRFTGSITVRYPRACPLGALHAEAQITRVDGVKTFASGYISDAEGITVEADGVFITPRWLRD